MLTWDKFYLLSSSALICNCLTTIWENVYNLLLTPVVTADTLVVSNINIQRCIYIWDYTGLNVCHSKHPNHLKVQCTHPDSSNQLRKSYITQHPRGYCKLEYCWGYTAATVTGVLCMLKLQHTLKVPSTVLQAFVVLRHIRPMQPVRRSLDVYVGDKLTVQEYNFDKLQDFFFSSKPEQNDT